MTLDSVLREQWLQASCRLRDKGLLGGAEASLSLRIPGSETMWFGRAADERPAPLRWCTAQAATPGSGPGRAAEIHAAVYCGRPDVGAVVCGGGDFGRGLADFGGTMPQVFDEQARHLGPMGEATESLDAVAAALRAGGNVLIVRGQPVCLGMTAARLALNAELFEKCAKAWVLAVAAGGPVQPLPWWVRLIANRRLSKDERQAAARFAQGLLPEESRGY